MRRILRVVVLTALVAATATTATAGAGAGGAPDGRRLVDVIVRTTSARDTGLRHEVARLGGRVERDLPIVHGFSARVPASAVARLRTRSGVLAVTPDARVRMFAADPGLGYDATADIGSLNSVARLVRAADSWDAGYTGKGVDIALIDSGVAPVKGLVSGNVILGPDLSFESQDPDLRNLDTFGHGTHMASIIVGRDNPGTAADYKRTDRFNGIAPDARLVSIKVAAHDGATDVSQVIAAIDWVVQHRKTNGLNIRVLNLSFGTDSTQDYRLDPLAYAAEVAMRSGIVVVAAVGNDGSREHTVADPAINPAVLAVNASNWQNTLGVGDDFVPDWATKGAGSRGADVVAPGVSVVGLRSPGSYIDQNHPGGRVGTRFFRGSGTSQATAVVSGAMALLVQRYPTMSAFDLKDQLMYFAIPMTSEPSMSVGRGLIDVRAAQLAKPRRAKLPVFGTGTGLLELARGTAHVAYGGVELVGERDIMNKTWVGATWAPAALAGTTWTGGAWNGTTWTGTTWTSDAWFGQTWTGVTWTGTTWTGQTWTGITWTGQTWTGTTWTGGTWPGSTWTSNTWSDAVWASEGWR